jgi:phage portal protein BeeE
MEYTPREVSNDSAQFNETEKQQDVQLARIWRMPPHKVGIMDRATFSNIEQQAIEFVQDTIMPWLVMIEQAISRDLILAPQRYYARFNVAGLLRGDTASRFEAYSKAIQSGWMSVNDVRRLENLNPVDGGDTYFRNASLVPLDAPAGAAGAGTQGQALVDEQLAQLEALKKQVESGNGEELGNQQA